MIDQNIHMVMLSVPDKSETERLKFVYLKDYPNVKILTKASFNKQYPDSKFLKRNNLCVMGVNRKIERGEQIAFVKETDNVFDYYIVSPTSVFFYIVMWINSPWGCDLLLDDDDFFGNINKHSLENIVIPCFDDKKGMSLSWKFYALETLGCLAAYAKRFADEPINEENSVFYFAQSFLELTSLCGLMELLFPSDFKIKKIDILESWVNEMNRHPKFFENIDENSIEQFAKGLLSDNNKLVANVNKMKFFFAGFRVKARSFVLKAGLALS